VSAHCCPLVIALLRALGCEHAAKMHEQPDAEWTPDDLLVHMAEERWHLWPVLRRHGMAGLLVQLDADHALFEAEIRVLGRLSPSGARLLEAHSEREDRAVGALLQLPEIRALLGA
jgi:hypothetical protein